MKLLFKLSLLLLFSLQFQALRASHIAGADVSYRCLGGVTFEFISTLYLDCSGNAGTNPVGDLTFSFQSNACGSGPTWTGPYEIDTLPIPDGGDTIVPRSA